MRLKPLQAAPRFSVESVGAGTVTFEQFAGKSLLLMFHRYAGCPMCNIRLHSFAHEFPEFRARGLEAIAFFHSPAKEIRKHAGGRQYPFIIASDPKFHVYRQYGVETSWPRLMMSFMRPSVYAELFRALRRGFRGGKPSPQLAKMPADFFIRPDGRVHSVYYGRSIGDHMSLRDIGDTLNEVAK